MANIRTFNGGLKAMWQKYRWKVLTIAIPIIFTFGSWATYVEMSFASDGKRLDKIDQTLAKVADNQGEITQLLKSTTGQLDIILQLLGIKIQDSTMARWKNMPRTQPLDSLGRPIKNSTWLVITDDYLYGRILKWVNADTVLMQEAWDARPKQGVRP